MMRKEARERCIPRAHGAGYVLTAAAVALLTAASATRADAPPAIQPSAGAVIQKEKKKDSESPWLLVPTLSSNPKLGTSVGGMAGYMHYFDDASRVSIFGASAQYTSTGSIIAALTAKMSFQADHQRLLALVTGGNIKNDYDDFLGTGQPLKSEDHLRAMVLRYQYRVWGDWFVGAQALYTTYQMLGQSELDNELLQTLGLTGFKGGGVGVLVNLDSRDNEFSPQKGWFVNLNNVAYREWIAGENNYDAYRADIRYYRGISDRVVLALRQNNQWTVNAPASAYAPITLRGYKFGEYLGQYMSSVEAEARYKFAARWSATIFAGVGCLYGGRLNCTDSENVYPDAGAGIQYLIKQKEGMVLNLEYAKGKGDNQGIYMKFGYGY